MPVPCRLCRRPLRAVTSVMMMIGPVCLKRQRTQMRELLTTLRQESVLENLVTGGRTTREDLESLQTLAGRTSPELFGTTVNPQQHQLFNQLYGLSNQEMHDLSDNIVRTMYQERHRQVRPTAASHNVPVWSGTRRRMEDASVEFVTENTAIVGSEGGEHYAVTSDTCTCPHFNNRVRRHPEQYPDGCRHMQALHSVQQQLENSVAPLTEDEAHWLERLDDAHLAFRNAMNASNAADRERQYIAAYEEARRVFDAMPGDSNRLRERGERLVETLRRHTYPSLVSPVGETVQDEPPIEMPAINVQRTRPLFVSTQITDDAQREEILNTWRETRAWDGTWMQTDDEAYHRLMDEVEQDFTPIMDGTALGGTGNMFGVEIELEFPRGGYNEVTRELARLGLVAPNHNTRQSYHTRQTPGYWIGTNDGSLNSGLEMVAPILHDTPEHWAQVQKVLEVAKAHGAVVNSRTGCHNNINLGPVDSRAFNWQRLARAAAGHEKILYQMGGADAESYRRSGVRGQHRGGGYIRPMAEEIVIGENTDMATIKSRISQAGHSSILNCTHEGRIEFRQPNSTLDFQQMQAQIIVSNAIVHQAAVIKNNMPQDVTTPRLSDRALQMRRNDSERPDFTNEQAFRRFLDFLGTPLERKAAAWLYKRGSI